MELRLNPTEMGGRSKRRGALALSWLTGLLLACVFSGFMDLAAAKEFTGERWAVVIGVAEYEKKDLRLPYADNDADKFYDFLLSPSGGGFPRDHVRKLTNKQVTLPSLRSALGTFLRQAKREDYVVIYLSGHGVPDPRTTNNFYFLPSQADLKDLAGSAVEMSEVLKWVSDIPASRKLLITDACHSGALGTAGPAKGSNRVNEFLRNLGQAYEGLVVLTSSEGYQLSQVYEEKKHSYFTYFLLRALQEDASQVDGSITGTKDGVVDPREAYEWVRKQVMKATENAQIPDKGGDLGIGIPLALVFKTQGPGTDVVSPPRGLTVAPDLPASPPSSMIGKDGAPMVLIPAGTFWMGSQDGEGDTDEHPLHPVYLNGFYMDKFEVTVGRYDDFMRAKNRPKPMYWDQVDSSKHRNLPVVGVDWHDATAYCEWAGKRLPAEAEWEKAARGTDGRTYPWGNEQPAERLANFNKGWILADVYNKRLAPVDSYEAGKSAYELHHMAGNVWEWTADWYNANYYNKSPERNPTGPSSGDFRVLRGGSWSYAPDDVRSATRTRYSPSTRTDLIGFRCAQDLPH